MPAVEFLSLPMMDCTKVSGSWYLVPGLQNSKTQGVKRIACADDKPYLATLIPYILGALCFIFHLINQFEFVFVSPSPSFTAHFASPFDPYLSSTCCSHRCFETWGHLQRGASGSHLYHLPGVLAPAAARGVGLGHPTFPGQHRRQEVWGPWWRAHRVQYQHSKPQ